MKKYLQVCLFGFLMFGSLVAPSSRVYAEESAVIKRDARLEIVSQLGDQKSRGMKTVSIFVDPGSQLINAVFCVITYDKRSLRPVGVEKLDIAFSYVVEESVDEEMGTVTLGYVALGGVSATSTLARVSFERIDSSIVDELITIGDDSMILANDGYGTNVLR